MKPKRVTARMALLSLVLVSFAVLSAPLGTMPSASASDEHNRVLHITKECAHFGSGFCTITSSNIPQIPPLANVYYDQAAANPAGMLDSNVVLRVGTLDWAVGRCTLDPATASGLCTFSDGVGPLAGFKARINVSPTGGGTFRWDGTYSLGGQNEENEQ